MIIQLIVFGAIGSPSFLKGLNEAENFSKCGDEASRPRVFLHMNTHVFLGADGSLSSPEGKTKFQNHLLPHPQWSWHKAAKVVCKASAARCIKQGYHLQFNWGS